MATKKERPDGAHAPDAASAEEVIANSGAGPGGTSEPAPFGGEEMQETANAEQAKGYRGSVPDPTPNANYTVAGVTSGAPTPETDADAFNDAHLSSGLR